MGINKFFLGLGVSLIVGFPLEVIATTTSSSANVLNMVSRVSAATNVPLSNSTLVLHPAVNDGSICPGKKVGGLAGTSLPIYSESLTIPADGFYSVSAVVYACQDQSSQHDFNVYLLKNRGLAVDVNGNVTNASYTGTLLGSKTIRLVVSGWTAHDTITTARTSFRQGDKISLMMLSNTFGVFTGGYITATRIP